MCKCLRNKQIQHVIKMFKKQKYILETIIITVIILEE